MDKIELYFKDGTMVLADSVLTDAIGITINDAELMAELLEMGLNGDLTGYHATTPEGEVVNPEEISEFIGMTYTLNDDGDAYSCVLSFTNKSDIELLQERLEALEIANEELSEYAEAGQIMLGEEIEE